VIPHNHRGLGPGKLLGQSYLHYAPQLGYREFIFNLVHADNLASMRTWDKLGFTRVGVVPGAGKRVRKRQSNKDGNGEEEVYYVDVHIIYKSLVEGER
jgi:L-amino acid N-acyltransferase YncA